jgi:hypothetical protein
MIQGPTRKLMTRAEIAAMVDLNVIYWIRLRGDHTSINGYRR